MLQWCFRVHPIDHMEISRQISGWFYYQKEIKEMSRMREMNIHGLETKDYHNQEGKLQKLIIYFVC